MGFTLTAGRTVTVDANRNVGGITFSNTSAFGYTHQTGSLRLSNGGVIQTAAGNGAHTDTISSAIGIQGNGGSATFTAGANVAVVKSGNGTWQFLGGMTFTGGLTLSGGRLATNGSNRLGNGTVTFNGGALGSTDANVKSATNAILFTGNGTIDTFTLSGTLVFGGTFKYTGATNVDDGVLQVASLSAAGQPGPLGSGTLVLTGANTATGVDNKTFTLFGTSTADNSIGVIAGTSTYSGQLRVSEGTLVVAADVASTNASPFGTAALLVEGSKTIDRGLSIAALGVGSSQVAVLGNTGAGTSTFAKENNIQLGRSVTLQASNSGTAVFGNNWVNASGPVAFTIGSDGNAGVVALESALPASSGSRSLTKTGLGTLTLSATNTSTGATNVLAGGALVLGNTGWINSTSGIGVAAGGRFAVNSSAPLTIAPVLAQPRGAQRRDVRWLRAGDLAASDPPRTVRSRRVGPGVGGQHVQPRRPPPLRQQLPRMVEWGGSVKARGFSRKTWARTWGGVRSTPDDRRDQPPVEHVR